MKEALGIQFLATKYNSKPLNNRVLLSMESIQFPNHPIRSGAAKMQDNTNC